MKAVYSYFFPEVRNILREVQEKIPDELFSVSIPSTKSENALNSMLKKPIHWPKNEYGCIDLDEIHVPIIRRIVSIYSPVISGLSGFSFAYPTSGSSEGLFHLLTSLRTNGVDAIHVLEGEYEGYGAQAQNVGIRVVSHSIEDALTIAKPCYWFISNPSARDGNIIPDSFIQGLLKKNHKLVLDFAYVGTTRKHVFDANHPNILAVVLSFSKPYGVFRFRMGGFLFTRGEIPSLYGNKWFKDVSRLIQALVLAERIGPRKLHSIYGPIQKKIVQGINAAHGLSLRPSDSFLLANCSLDAGKIKTELQPFIRGSRFRFCLTPYFEDIHSGNSPVKK